VLFYQHVEKSASEKMLIFQQARRGQFIAPS
jgi:hypothetical protein